MIDNPYRRRQEQQCHIACEQVGGLPYPVGPDELEAEREEKKDHTRYASGEEIAGQGGHNLSQDQKSQYDGKTDESHSL